MPNQDGARSHLRGNVRHVLLDVLISVLILLRESTGEAVREIGARMLFDMEVFGRNAREPVKLLNLFLGSRGCVLDFWVGLTHQEPPWLHIQNV
jgi:hypothetical protein